MTQTQEPKKDMDEAQLRRLYAEFCQDMLNWVAEGCPNTNPHGFNKTDGLCTNNAEWIAKHSQHGLRGYQSGLFVGAQLDRKFPFDGTREAYSDSRITTSFYKNKARMQWLRDHAEQEAA